MCIMYHYGENLLSQRQRKNDKEMRKNKLVFPTNNNKNFFYMKRKKKFKKNLGKMHTDKPT